MSEIQGIGSAEIAAEILDVISKQDGPVRAIDVSKAMGFSKSRLHKYLVSLCRSGLLQQSPDTGLYSLGYKLISLAKAAEKQNQFLIRVNQELCRFSEDFNISTGLTVRHAGFIRMLQYNRSKKPVDIHFCEDMTVPIDCCVTGHLFQVYQQQDLGLVGEDESREILRQGYVVGNGTGLDGEAPGTQVIACPVFDGDSRIVAAAFASGFLPSSRSAVRELALQLIDAVRNAMGK